MCLLYHQNRSLSSVTAHSAFFLIQAKQEKSGKLDRQGIRPSLHCIKYLEKRWSGHTDGHPWTWLIQRFPDDGGRSRSTMQRYWHILHSWRQSSRYINHLKWLLEPRPPTPYIFSLVYFHYLGNGIKISHNDRNNNLCNHILAITSILSLLDNHLLFLIRYRVNWP